MPTFEGTTGNDRITPTVVSPGVTRNPAGSFPGAAGDTLQGGDGSDTLRGGDGADLLANRFTPFGEEDGIADQLFGESGNDTLVAGALDSADGGTGNDLIRLVAGSPTAMTGGTGNDTLQADSGISIADATLSGVERLEISAAGFSGGTLLRATQLDDFLSIAALGGASTGFIRLVAGGTSTFTPDASLDLLVLTGSAESEALTQAAGSTTTLSYVGSTGNAFVIARAAADTLQGGDGSDTLRGGDGGDLLANRFTPFGEEDGVADQLFGEGGNDTLVAGALDSADGGAGNDLIRLVAGSPAGVAGGTGNDTLQADSGISIADATLSGVERLEVSSAGFGGGALLRATQLDDFLSIAALDGASTGFIRLVAGGTSTFTPDGSLDLLVLTGSAESESLTQAAGSTTTLSYVGSTGNAFVIARAAADTLQGGDGSDTLRGGDGGDLLANRFNPFGEEDGVADQLFGEGGSDTLVAGALDSADGGAGNDELEAIGAATLIGGVGNDTLIGSLGNDSLVGAGDSDTASYESSNAAVTVSLAIAAAQNTGGGGTDFLSSVENLVGGNGSDSLTGNAGQNILRGGNGNDTLDGGGGSDTASYQGAGGPVTVDLRIAGPQVTGAGSDELVRIENLIGGSGNDSLAGNAGANVIEGSGGNDTLSGLGGIDTASFAGAASRIVASLALAGAQNTQGAGSDLLSGFENLTGSAFNDALTGNAGANLLSGGGGNDNLRGADGSDTLDGGAGRDTASYAGAVSAVAVSLAIAGPQNTLGAGLDSLVSIENVTGSGFADTLTGDGLANLLTGGAGNDSVSGGAGNDTLDGAAGNDVLAGGAGIDTATYASATASVTVNLNLTGNQATGGSGLDRLSDIENLIGGSSGDSLTGSTAANRLEGRDGDDRLAGGAGDDTLVSGIGADIFAFAAGSSRDVITDFSESEDRLGVSGFGLAYDSVAEIIAVASQIGNDVVIVIPDPGAATNSTIVMQGYLLALLDASDFAFVTP